MINNYKGDFIAVSNIRVYGLNESIKASGYPMIADIGNIDTDVTEADIKRSNKLGSAKAGSGHDTYLKGIIVQFDMSACQYLWQQAKRYHWFDFVSSTSTMHRITKMDISDLCNKFVSVHTISLVKHLIYNYNILGDNEIIPDDMKFVHELEGVDNVFTKKDLFHAIISNLPSGFSLSARMTTNYLQLKTIYLQRKHHKLHDWREFCEFCESLPHFKEFVGINK